jgi:2,4-diketo-3-deoxy-L-fuconate hydrolase
VKLVTYATDAGPRVGVIDRSEVIPIPGIPDMLTFLQNPSLNHTIEAALKGRIDVQPLNTVHLLAPVPRPPKIIGIGLNYLDHAEETGQSLPKAPILFSKPPTAVIGPNEPILIPLEARQVDYEVELGVVIGKGGRKITEKEAPDFIGGYTVFNDISARDHQFRDGQWFRGKSFDTFAPMGPCLALPDQLPDAQNLKLRLQINGETRQESNTSNMIFSVTQLISEISNVMTLEAGDVIATGTPAGVGFVAKPKPLFLKVGDIIEAEIEGIGFLRNPVEEEKKKRQIRKSKGNPLAR